MEQPISIIIPAFNEIHYCRQCIQSIQLNTRRPYKLILVDNGSTDGVSEYFDSIPDAVVLHAGENLGFAGGVNLGLQETEGHVVLLNSDTLVPPGWLGRLEAAMLREDDLGMVGPMSNCVSGSQQIDGLDFQDMDEITAYAEQLAKDKAGELRQVARLVGFCLLIRDQVVQEVGIFDEAYGIGNFEDDDYCLRTLRAGYRLCVAEDCFVFHYGSRTFLAMGLLEEKWDNLIQENQRRFFEKWEVQPHERIDIMQQAYQINQRAKAFVQSGDMGAAIRLYKEGMEAAPGYEMNYNDLGVVLWGMGEGDLAYTNFKRALQCNICCAEARDNLIMAAQSLGCVPEAEALLADLEQDTKGDPHGH
jgi:glycosyltransferase involved in cell wall biosynthesis